ncbi:phosphomannomutase [Taylorella equigenitalis]|uniref:phosphomannomutase n=1 Tax=Taylorella equigenitalis TaxID=29575 RepID=UPI000419D850|nr:phosphomannomutase [Taylorella equigenitalis]ASY30096.1 phosphomannomutase [Taylorella equigenitalis]KOS58683.1 phosphomannomutase [Taylorella equigenitalis]
MLITTIPLNVFKEYDIRGHYPDEINPQFTYLLGFALMEVLPPQNIGSVLIAHDAREGGPELAKALYNALKTRVKSEHIQFAGLEHPGLLAIHNIHKNYGLIIYITASHNPVGFNGFKIYCDSLPIDSETIKLIAYNMKRLADADFKFLHYSEEIFEQPPIEEIENSEYINALLSEPDYCQEKYILKIAIDGGNGVAGLIARELYEKMGHEVLELNCVPDGTFPNHHPDPSVPDNLMQLRKFVVEHGCDIGLAFDGDADRLGVVDYQGQIIGSDRVFIFLIREMMKFYKSYSDYDPAKPVHIVYDIKSSRHIQREIEAAGALPHLSKTGHSNMMQKVAQIEGALFGGEYSGHYYFKKDGLILNDAVYSGFRILRFIEEVGPEAFEHLPHDLMVPEIRIPYPRELVKGLLLHVKDSAQKNLNPISFTEIDGLRIEIEGGFLLMRPSNTEQKLTIVIEATSEEELCKLLDFTIAVLEDHEERLKDRAIDLKDLEPTKSKFGPH